MAFTAGDFTASDLQASILGGLDDIWASPITKKKYIQAAPIFESLAQSPYTRAITDEEKKFFNDPRNCQSLKLSFLGDPDEADPVAAGTNGYCAPTGPQIGSDSVTYAKPGGREKSFSVKEVACENLASFSQKMAESMMSKRATFIKYLEKSSISFLIANRDDVGTVSIGGTATGEDDIWSIGAGLDEKAMIRMNHYAADNRLIAPRMYAGNKFRYEEAVFSATAGGGTTNTGSLLLSPDIPVVRDTFNFDALTTTEDFFIVDTAGIGHVNYNHATSYEMPSDRIMLDTPYYFIWEDPEIQVWDPVLQRPRPYRWDVQMNYKCLNDGANLKEVVVVIRGYSGFLKAPVVGSYPLITQVKFKNAA